MIRSFRKDRLREVLPTEAREISVEKALQQQRIGGVNRRKLLTAQWEKFCG